MIIASYPAGYHSLRGVWVVFWQTGVFGLEIPIVLRLPVIDKIS